MCCLGEPLGRQNCWKSMCFCVKSKPLEIDYLEPTPRRLKSEICRHRQTLTYSEPNETEAPKCGLWNSRFLSFARDVRQKAPPWTCAFWERSDGGQNCDFWTSEKALKSCCFFGFWYVSAPLGGAFCWKSIRRMQKNATPNSVEPSDFGKMPARRSKRYNSLCLGARDPQLRSNPYNYYCKSIGPTGKR